MKNKTLITYRRKKSIASLFLALLLMFSFNSTPIIMLANRQKTTNAYQKTETQTYYSKTSSENESNFADGKYPSSMESAFSGSSKNFNVYNYYTNKFETFFREYIEEFFSNWDGTYETGSTENTYSAPLEALKSHCNNATTIYEIYEYYTSDTHKTYFNNLKTQYSFDVDSFQEFVEFLALYGLPNYNESASLPPFVASFASSTNTTHDQAKNLSVFYRLLRCKITDTTYDSYKTGTPYEDTTDTEGNLVKGEETINNSLENRQAFYTKNTHYLAVKSKITTLVEKTAPAYVFDGKTQDTNVAAIFANDAKLSLSYNYSTDYETYTLPNISSYENATVSNVKYNKVYYWGNTTDVSSRNEYTALGAQATDVWIVEPSENKVVNALKDFLYRPIQVGEYGYIDGITTYYKFGTNGASFTNTTSGVKSLYILNDNPTQSELDTYTSINANVISQAVLDEDKAKTNIDERYYINIPYETDEVYLKAVYETLLYSRPFTFEEFLNYVTYKDASGKTQSKVYIKLAANNAKNIVYINADNKSSFTSTYPDYAYRLETFTSDEFIADDYVEITSSSTNSGYRPSGFDDETYSIYFKKVKNYYTDGTTSTYQTTGSDKDKYEQEKTIIKNLEKDTIASAAYEMSGADERKLYVFDDGSILSEGNLPSDLADKGFTSSDVITQDDLDKNPNYYVKALSYSYDTNSIDTKYTLYYKHTDLTGVDKIYVVDDADNASENKIYKTLNYHVISSSEYKAGSHNYLAIAEGDDNYNSNFLLYYKYERNSIIPSTASKYIYILKDDIAEVENYETILSSHTYSIVEKDDVAEYNLIDEDGNASIYLTARTAFFGSEAAGSDPAPTLHLYYKATNVFVQNELKGGNAIYVSYSSSLNDSSRTTYSEHFWTPVKNTEITNNPDLYVLLTKDDANYNEDYKLYYRYIEADETHNKIYSIDDIDTTASDFDSRDYELIVNNSMYGYEQGKELYYKKTILSTSDNIITKPAFYYYQTSSTVTLSSNSYYAISFYVYTVGENARASFIIKDTAGVMDDIVLDNINTGSKWQQYYIFISTDISTASTINLYLYLGDEEHGIKGDNDDHVTSITGSVFFDDIRINTIGLTDYNKQALNNVPVYSTLYKNNDGDEVTGQYADEYNNRIFIANKETEDLTRFVNNNYEFKNLITNPSSVSDYKNFKWNDMFDFDNASDDLKNILGYYDSSSDSTSTEGEGESSAATDTTVANQLKEKTLAPYYDSTNKRYNLNGYKMYNLYDTDTAITADNDMFPTLWRYYLARSYGYDGTSLKKYLNAYESGDLEVSITNKIEETKKSDDDDDDDDDTSTDSGDITYISNPFNNNNFALKLKNTNTDSTLGITSNAFMIEQFGYYKITIWIYSPDKDGKASLALNSVMYNGKANDYGSLLSASISSTSANVANSTAKVEEYGWSQVTFYVEGNACRDMQCYLVLSAGSNSTVYFDNITIEKITSKVYDSNTSSGSYSASLSLTPTDNYDATGIKNGNFDYVVETNTDLSHNVNSSEPRTADSWTAFSANSSRVTAGVVSTKNQSKFFQKYAGGETNRPYENFGGSLVDDFSNVYAIYAPDLVDTIKEDAVGNKSKIDYEHNYSIYSGSFSITTNSFYKITFKFYKTASFNGTLVSNLYLSSVKDANIFASIKIDSDKISDGWHTYTYYIQTGTSSQTVYLSLGVENATGLCYFKNATMAKDSSGKTYDEVLADIVKKNGIDSTATEDIQNAIKDVRFVDMTDLNLGYHTPTEDETTGLYNQKVFTDNTSTTDKHTSGKTGVVVANYFSSVQTTTYSVTINKVTYYIGEVYKVNINDTDYFVHKTYNAKSNAYEYKLYSDSALTQEVTKIDDKEVKIESTSTGIKVTVDSTEIGQDKITTTYRLYKFSDLREEVTEIDGSEVKVENLNKVVVGTGSKATENKATSETNTSYLYHFVEKDYEFNNTIIPSSELVNNQSGNVLILANGYSTDYITIKQTTTRTIGKSTYNVLRFYVKTSDFDSEDFGLNIEIAAIDTSWKNINTTKSEYADEYGFVCYEVLISTNSTDSVSDFAVKLSLGNEENLGYGYAIISDISLNSFASKEAFEHYSSLVDDDNETVKKKLYAENESTDSSTDDEDEEEPDDKNSVSWATFFYIFSSILLVVTMVVAMVALILKKHPIKFAKKYVNTHERDIDSVSSKKQTTPAKVTKAKDAKEIKDRNNSGGII